MNRQSLELRGTGLLFALALAIALEVVSSASAASTSKTSDEALQGQTRTAWKTVDQPLVKWVTKTITNEVEIWMPTNIFVNEYHTNYRPRFITNVVEVPKTNWVGVTVTNTRNVTLFRTNNVTAYRTNWVDRSITNHQIVALTRTNWVTALQTNYRTLNITNWETVVEFKTNNVSRQIRQVVEVDESSRPPAGISATSPQAIRPSGATAPGGQRLALRAEVTGEGDSPGEVNVRLSAQKSEMSGESVEIAEWLVAREDAPVLFAMKEKEFKRSLSPGTYIVEMRAQYVPSGREFTSKARVQLTARTIRVLSNPELVSRTQ